MVVRSFDPRLRRRNVSLSQAAGSASVDLQSHPSAGRALTLQSSTPRNGALNLDTPHFDSKVCTDELPPHGGGLERTIQGDVIPRLMLALADPMRVTTPVPLQLTSDHVCELTALVLSRDEPNLEHYAGRLQAQGISLSAIYLQLIAQTARALGEKWSDDTADFTQVTVGLGRLHKLVHQLSPAFQCDRDLDRARSGKAAAFRRILIAPAPGEQHTLGCAIVEEFFAKAGWIVSGWPLVADTDLVGLVASDYFDVIGLSVSCETRLNVVTHYITKLRAASLNTALIVMVGGRVFSDSPALVRDVGADLTAAHGDDAVAAAEAAVMRGTFIVN